MEAGISANQAWTSPFVRWKPILGWLGATPFVAILAMELYFKFPVSIAVTERPRNVPVEARQVERALDGYAYHSIAARCRQRWPSDRSMQLICAQHAEGGLADLARIYIANLNAPGMTTALTDCFDSHTSEGITDFASVGVCARTQELNSRLQTPIPALTYSRNMAPGARSADRRPVMRVIVPRERPAL